MIFVPGFEFIAGTSKKTSVLRDRAVSSADKDFETGRRYRLYHIKPNKDENNIVYLFRRDDGEMVKLTFESVSAADKKIAKLAGEQI